MQAPLLACGDGLPAHLLIAIMHRQASWGTLNARTKGAHALRMKRNSPAEGSEAQQNAGRACGMVAAPRAPAPRLPFGSTMRMAPRRSGVRLAPRRAAPPPPPGPPLICLLGLGSGADLQPAPLLAAGLGGRAGDAAAPAGEQPAPPGFCFAVPAPMSLATCAQTQRAQVQALRQLSAAHTEPGGGRIGSVSPSDSQESGLCSSAAPAQMAWRQCNAWHPRTHSSSLEQGPDADPLRRFPREAGSIHNRATACLSRATGTISFPTASSSGHNTQQRRSKSATHWKAAQLQGTRTATRGAYGSSQLPRQRGRCVAAIVQVGEADCGPPLRRGRLLLASRGLRRRAGLARRARACAARLPLSLARLAARVRHGLLSSGAPAGRCRCLARGDRSAKERRAPVQRSPRPALGNKLWRLTWTRRSWVHRGGVKSRAHLARLSRAARLSSCIQQHAWRPLRRHRSCVRQAICE